jgi:hypothetical protein
VNNAMRELTIDELDAVSAAVKNTHIDLLGFADIYISTGGGCYGILVTWNGGTSWTGTSGCTK